MTNKTHEIIYLTTVELRRLFDQLTTKRDQAMYLIAYRHALRASEVGLLQREGVDLENGRIRFSRLKGSLSGEHPLMPDEKKALRAYLKTRKDDHPALFLTRQMKPIHRSTLDRQIKKFGELAGLPKHKRHFHVLKRSIATHMLNASGDLFLVKDWCGHVKIDNTIAYLQYANKHRDQKAAHLFATDEVV